MNRKGIYTHSKKEKRAEMKMLGKKPDSNIDYWKLEITNGRKLFAFRSERGEVLSPLLFLNSLDGVKKKGGGTWGSSI